jgi:hypothetical protein
MYTGKLAADVIIQSQRSPASTSKRLHAYERKVFRAMSFYWEMVERFYTTPFMELFMEPRHRLKVPEAIVAILAGELEGGWKIAWRRWLFFLLIAIQRRYPLVPRISFQEPPPGSASPPPGAASPVLNVRDLA